MTGTPSVVVVDASAMVPLLVDAGDVGDWVATHCWRRRLAAPHLMAFEVSNVLRRHEASGLVDRTSAALAVADLADLAVEYWPYAALAERIWDLRSNLTSYDAAYVAVAELLDAPMVTLDTKLARAPGLRCQMLVFEP